MTLKTHEKKRIEIMIEAAALYRIIEVLDRFGVTGYTVLPALAGRGMSGDWQRDDAFGDTARIVSVVCITDPSKEEDVLLATKDIVERYIGIVSVCDVKVLRSEHF